MRGLGKSLDSFFVEVTLLDFSTGVSQLIKMAPLILKNTVSIAFWAVIVCATLEGISAAYMTIFADDRSPGETQTRPLS
jgi:hypothetical protein